MQSNTRRLLLIAAFTVFFPLLTPPSRLFAASKEKVLHSFAAGQDGYLPYAGVILDAAGNLYGTTIYGGRHHEFGTAFRLSLGKEGKWQERILHNFNGIKGDLPNAGLIFDAAGNLYGTTPLGPGYGGCAFELVSRADGTWTETVLHSFDKQGDGANPYGSLIFDAAGNLYGTTFSGGLNGNGGTVFQLSPGKNGQWTETVLHSFTDRTDGSGPFANLIFDAVGNLYGTTFSGGLNGNGGTVFQLSPGKNGQWTETVLHSFGKGNDGAGPLAGLIFDAAGNLYSTTEYGGAHNYGTIFELSPGTNGTWTETVLYSFNDNGQDGYYPYAGLIFDAAGNLYGTTVYGGASGTTGCNGRGCGTIFELTPGARGTSTEKVLYSFCSASGCTDGFFPYGGLIFDTAGNLYGTTYFGGTDGYGTVFEFTP